MNFLLVALGGCVGSMLRFYISMRFNKKLLGTMIANITGSILLAWLVGLYASGELSQQIWLIAGVGFSGAYTTFSTFSHETLNLLSNRQFLAAACYVLSSFGSAIILVYIVLAFF